MRNFEKQRLYWVCYDCVQKLCDSCQILYFRSNVSKQYGIWFFCEDKDDEMEFGSDVIDIDDIELYIC